MTSLPAPSALLAKAREYLRQAKSPHTRRAYRADWAHFASWCDREDREPLPAAPDTLVLYLTALAATHTAASLARRLSAVSQAHQAAGCVSPTHQPAVRAVMAGIRRAKGTAAQAKKPVLVADLARMLATLPDSLLGVRNRALLLVGFAGAFRRSELVALDWEDVAWSSEGLTIRLRRSKTDPEGAGRKIGIPYGRVHCPVRALAAWRDETDGSHGPVFRRLGRHGNLFPSRLSDKAVARLVKSAIAAAGLDPAGYSGHSLRAGLATAAAMAGASERAIMNQTGHRSLATVRRYIRDGSLFRDNAAAASGL
ncbi:MAG TPA: site-specific integrase [Bryobacteraceae bacterium]|nr:site-specific integrase [Bryobacteraceae bacterium]